VSKRSLRPDPNFDALISKIYPFRDEYEAHQERVLARIKQSINPSSMAQNVEEGLRQQAVNRAQRVKKQPSADVSQIAPSSLASEDWTHSSHPRLTDTSALSADQPSDSGCLAAGSSLACEIELVMRPHLQPGTPICDGQTRFIKTTSNATGN